jgi:TP901 family phage tail tape measure protein
MAGTSKSLVEVGISMVLRDGFSQQAGRISSSYTKLMNDMNQWNRAVTQSAGAAFDYGTQLVGGMYEAYKHSAEVSNQIFMTSKIAGATAEQSKRLMEVAQQVNMQTPLTNYDIASGERYLAMAGNSAEAIESMIGPAAKLASIFEMQLGGKGGVADLMTNIMATFGIASKDASKVADILGVATTSANINLTDLAQSLQYSGATFRNAGIDLQTSAAAIGVLGDQGIQASSAGTALANMIRYLTLSITGQKAKGAKMLEAMGISKDELVDSYGNLKDLGTLMTVIANKMGKLSGTAREAAMYNIFGVRGQRAASGLFQAIWNGSDKMQKIIDKVNGSGGWTEDTINERSKTPQGRVDALNASIDNLKVGLGEAMTIFTPLITGMSKLANWIAKISTTGIGGFVVKLVTSATIVTTLIAGFSLIRGTLRMVVTMMGSLTATATAASTATASMNTGAAMLEAHLRTIVALMAEYVALSYAPGTRGMMLPMGGRLGRNKAGKPYVGGFGKKGGAMSTATYAGAYVPKPASGGSTGGSTGGGSGVASKGLGLAGMASMMFGGPVGIGIGLALTGLSMGLDYYISSVEANTEAVNANTQELSAQEVQSAYNERYVRAIEQAIKAGGTNTNSLNLTINGTSVGTFRDGDSVPIDGYGFYY